jgi:hypothetical protein
MQVAPPAPRLSQCRPASIVAFPTIDVFVALKSMTWRLAQALLLGS